MGGDGPMSDSHCEFLDTIRFAQEFAVRGAPLSVRFRQELGNHWNKLACLHQFKQSVAATSGLAPSEDDIDSVYKQLCPIPSNQKSRASPEVRGPKMGWRAPEWVCNYY